MVQDAVNRANSELASFESIKHFRILDEDFCIESGLLTPTLKLRRKQITARYLPLLSSLY
jgi:long-chain acyl-CoA synthetase